MALAQANVRWRLSARVASIMKSIRICVPNVVLVQRLAPPVLLANKMKKFYFAVIGCILSMSFLSAQDIPVSLEYTQVYSFVDELIVDCVISRQTTVQPYTRRQIAEMLQEAEGKDSLLSKRQQKDLQFYLNAFALERDTIQKNVVQYSNNRTFNLSLFNPQFSYITKNKKFKMTIEPILGMDLYGSKKGAVIKRWWGVDRKSVV